MQYSMCVTGVDRDSGKEDSALPDHARVTAADISFSDALPVLMTEKDAVKSLPFADQRHWAVRMDVMVSEQDAAAVQAMLDRLG